MAGLAGHTRKSAWRNRKRILQLLDAIERDFS